jgi:predicted acetyltransferase
LRLNDIRLIGPTEEFREEFAAYVAELVQAGENVPDDLLDAARGRFDTFVRGFQDAAEGRNLAPGLVPWNTYWLVLNGRLLGMSSLRHRLTPGLEDRGGHIGYNVRPSERQKGYGTRLLALTLRKARALGLERVLLTCDSANIASARVIEKNGGVLASEEPCKLDGTHTRRYWIAL